jgi:HAD superfamily phosphatase
MKGNVNDMSMSSIWRRTDLQLPPVFDTIFFDVDGVLIRTTGSFRAADIAVAEYVVGTLHGLDWGQNEGHALVTVSDIEAFKQAGGFNDDFTLSYLLAGLFTARLREWRDSSLGEQSIVEWAARARESQLRGQGGRVWADEVIPASARQDFEVIRDLHIEYYWGVRELRKRFGREPRYLPEAEGLVRSEEWLFAPDFFARLRASGISHLGMITGRVGPEVDSALERLWAYCGEQWWDVVVPATEYVKPDPQALRHAIAAVGARGGLFIGDTADDLDLVLNYHARQQDGEPPMLAAMIADGAVAELYQQRGADFVVDGVEDLLMCLREPEAEPR